MQITVNDQPRELASSATLEELLAELDIPARGTAVAVNQNIIPRSLWPEQGLDNGDRVMVIRATAGG